MLLGLRVGLAFLAVGTSGFWLFDRLAFGGIFVVEFDLEGRAKDGSLTVKLGFFPGVEVGLFFASFGFVRTFNNSKGSSIGSLLNTGGVAGF